MRDWKLDESVLEACASSAHEVNRAYCRALGDLSQPSWADAPDWQKESAKLGVMGALSGNTPRQSHEGWLEVKAKDGWKYGEVKDPEKKLHPCMRPYDQLPPEQQKKDHLFLATVNAVFEALKTEGKS